MSAGELSGAKPNASKAKCRLLDTQVSLSDTCSRLDFRCLCFFCRLCSRRTNTNKRHKRGSRPTTTTTIINCHHQPPDANQTRASASPCGAALISIELVEPDDDRDAGEKNKVAGAVVAVAEESSIASTLSNLDDVKRNFLALIRHNKLQYFFLGTLIYSAINTCSIFKLINDGADANSSHRPSTTDRLQLVFVLALNLTLIFLLLAVATLMALRFGGSSEQVASRARRGDKFLQVTGLITTLMTLYLQLVLHLLLINSLAAAAGTGPAYGAAFHWTSLELVSAVLLYILPLLLEPLSGCCTGSLASLPALVAALYWPALKLAVVEREPSTELASSGALQSASNQQRSGDNHLIDNSSAAAALKLVVFLALAILFGLLRRQEFTRTIIKSTFAGATELIEAKVSLEHQRQQQETLLLSVLPAYVAEQVKRNMLKSTTTAPGAATNSAEPLSASGGGQLMHSASAVVQAAGLGAAGGPMRSQSVDESAAGGSAKSASSVNANRLTSIQVSERVRNPSFALAELFTSRLASGAAFLSETLGGGASDNSADSKRHHPTPASNNSQLSPTTACGQPLSMPAPPPTPTIPSGAGSGSQARRGFNELYIRTYNNVSLLYGDIVGFTRLCTQLSSSQLVGVLNDLFSHFDYLAEKHKIMRIKILGDCYYGVSGIPEFAVMGAKSRASRNDNHAINCVNMGLDMIQYIRQLNIERQQQEPQTDNQCAKSEPAILVSTPGGAARDTSGHSREGSQRSLVEISSTGSPLPEFELNMRIGIHSGHIHSGVIGLKKWQFDVWSNDVSIAMHCESSGFAGRVQVTEATVQQLDGAFSYERAPISDRDPFLAQEDIRTYLIKETLARPHPMSPATLHLGGESTHRLSSATRRDLSPVSRANQHHLSLSRPPGKRGSSKRSRKVTSDQHEAGSRRDLHEADSRKKQDQMDNENTIRVATIDTIRQTLLSGDDASDQNPYGLAFNHLDISPIGLSYRDPAIARLFSQRPIQNLVQDLLALTLLTLLLYLVNNQSFSNLELPAVILPVICFILLLLLVSVALARALVSTGADLSNNMYTGDANALEPEFDRQSVIEIKSEKQRTSSILSGWSKLALPRLNSLIRPLIDSDGGSIGSRKRFRLAANGLVLISVSLFQCFPLASIRNSPCLSTNSTTIQHSVIEQQMQNNINIKEQDELTVILLLMMADSSANLIGYRIKCLLFLIIIACQSFRLLLISTPLMARCKPNLADVYPWQVAQQIHAEWSSCSLSIILVLWSLAYARQLEYTNKANFLWRNRLNVDHEELEYISGINKVLLENILPSHVVQHYLTQPNEQLRKRSELMPSLLNYMRMSFSNMRNSSRFGKLYHEQHDGVAVMFASIPHFYEFYDESDISKQGLGCIALLNEIICDFDKLLLKNKFSRIEKIKTIGSTYMAAAGLRPCNLTGARNSNVSQVSVASSQPRMFAGQGRANQQSGASSTCDSVQLDGANERRLVLSQQKQNLICMIQFASNLMTALNTINKQSFQVFKLRVGVNTGAVVAGVIGAQRPFYDIWGDCVNIASRMESLGEVGRIQVEERTAELLMESLCAETYSIVRRGPIDVKGKGGMVTYFVDRKATGGDEQQQQQLGKETLTADTNHKSGLLSPRVAERRTNSKGAGEQGA